MSNSESAVMISDVTECHRMLQALQESESRLKASEERYRTIVEDLVELVTRHDADFRVTYANHAVERMFGGLFPDGIVGTTFFDIIPREYQARLRTKLEALTPEHPVTDDENPKTLASGETRWFAFTNRALFDASGRRVGYQSVGRDITERRAAVEALRASEARLTAFLQHAPVGMWVKDRDGRFVMLNPEMERATNCSNAAMLGQTMATALPGMAMLIASRDRELLEAGMPMVHEDYAAGAEGYEYAQTIRFPIRDAVGAITHIGGFDLDITPQKRIEAEMQRQREALLQSEKMSAMGSLLAGVAHELNNPLSVVVLQAAVLAESAPDTATQVRAGKIQVAAERCARIVRTFLAMARQKPHGKRAVDLNDTVRGALEIASYGLRTADVEVTLDLAQGLPRLLAEEDLLHHVFANLLVNAQHALEVKVGSRQLAVTTRRVGDMVEAIFADNGPGIPPAIRGRVFEPFFTTKPVGAGTGIGLAICHSVVTAHGGTIALESPTEGGARFSLRLPIEALAVEPIADLPRSGALAPRRAAVLVVDDEPEIVDAVAEVLGRVGHEVVAAGSGRQALTILGRRAIDLILADIRMPDLDGPGLYFELGRSWPELRRRIVFMTGDTLTASVAGFLRETNAPVLEKPMQVEALLRAVEQALA